MLTDAQMAEIWEKHGPQDMALEEAYRLGMLRAADRCEEEGLAKVNHWTAIGDGEMVDYAKSQAWDLLQAAAAIRAEAGETSEPPCP